MELDVKNMTRDQLEVHSRKMESELNILNNRANVNPEGFKKDLDKRTKNYRAVQKRIQEMDAVPGAADPEGTSPTLADAEGNFADDARIAQIGGIGVRDSNTRPDAVLAKQRKRLAEAGMEDPESVPLNQLAGVLPPEEGMKKSSVDDSPREDTPAGERARAAEDRAKAAAASKASLSKK